MTPALEGIPAPKMAPVQVQLGILTKAGGEKASHLPPETKIGTMGTVIELLELSVKEADPSRLVGDVPDPLSS